MSALHGKNYLHIHLGISVGHILLILYFDKINNDVAPKGLFKFFSVSGYKDNAPPGLVVSVVSLPNYCQHLFGSGLSSLGYLSIITSCALTDGDFLF